MRPPSTAWSALVTFMCVPSLAGCDQTADPLPPNIAGAYTAEVREGRAFVSLTIVLEEAPSADGYAIGGSCKTLIFDGGLGCRGTCRLRAPVRPASNGQTRFTLYSEPDPGDPNDIGTATSVFDLTATPAGRRLDGTADFACTFGGGEARDTVTYTALPLSLQRIEEV